MIGCDVSGYGSSRVTEWRYREVSEDESAESESCMLVSFTLAAHLGVLLSPEHCLDLSDLRATVLPSWQSADKRSEVPDTRWP